MIFIVLLVDESSKMLFISPKEVYFPFPEKIMTISNIHEDLKYTGCVTQLYSDHLSILVLRDAPLHIP